MTGRSTSDRRLLGIVAACLLASAVFFSPRLWLMRHDVPGSFQWARADTFLLQCEQPLRRDIEPAMLWRLLPPAVCHAVRLPGKTPLALPWIGIICATSYIAVIFRRRLDDVRFIIGGTLLFATTSAVLVPLGWLGINDAWVWFGLLVVAFCRDARSILIAALLCPWIDERFLVGFPLAWLARRLDRGDTFSWREALPALGVAPYLALRLWFGRDSADGIETARAFLNSQLRQTPALLPLVPLGWWMGLRAAWLPIGYAGWTAAPRTRVAIILLLFGTAGAMVFMASDLSRSIAIVLPMAIFGCFAYARRDPGHAPKMILLLGLANLILPAVHVIYTKIDPISPLPIELLRLFRTS